MRIRLDPFVLALIVAAALGAVVPLGETVIDALRIVTKIWIAVLFFAYGARLSAAETWAGLTNWRLHLVILAITFVLFPAAGLAIRQIGSIDTPLIVGVLFLCALPSTIQSSVAATSIAGGNTAGAVISASASNILGVIVTPVLVALLLAGAAHGDIDLRSSAAAIALQLLVPFVLGQLSRPVTKRFFSGSLYGLDRGSIVLIVFVAFAAGRQADVWSEVTGWQIAAVVAGSLGALGVALAASWWLGRVVRLPRPDRITVLFCGSQKSLATGLPIAGILFEPSLVPLIAIPLLVYHQFQTIAAAMIATRMARSADD